MLYVPEGCGQGFLTLEDDTELAYTTSAFYAPEAERGFRYDDPAFEVVMAARRSRSSPRRTGAGRTSSRPGLLGAT